MSLISSGGRVHPTAGTTSTPDITLSGPPDPVVGLIAGEISRGDAEHLGVVIRGSVAAGLRSVSPSAGCTPAKSEWEAAMIGLGG